MRLDRFNCIVYCYSMKASPFSIAAHVLVSLESSSRVGEKILSSAALAESVNTNPVLIRRLLQKLSQAHLVETKEGSGGGVQLARRASAITLRQVYEAVEDAPLIKPNTRPVNKTCTVSCGITAALEPVVGEGERALLKVLGTKTIAGLADDIAR